MASAVLPGSAAARSAAGAGRSRLLLVAAVAVGSGIGVAAATGFAAVPSDGELARLLRFMAVLKSAMAAGAVAAVWWRLSVPAPLFRLSGYLAAAAAMAAGPGLIWSMAFVGWGAILLHGGLLAALVLLWRDPAVASKLGEAVARRRRSLAARPGA